MRRLPVGGILSIDEDQISRLFLDFHSFASLFVFIHNRLIAMTRYRTTFSQLLAAAILSVAVGGCYLFNDDRFADWLEYRIERAGDENGVLVAKVNRRADKAKWPGDSYEVLVRWPTNVEFLPRDVDEKDRRKEAQAFLRTLCGENQKIFLIEESFNDRTGEVYFNLWCQPVKQG